MIPAGLTSESVRAGSDLCCKFHFDLSLGTAFEILILAFNQFSVPSVYRGMVSSVSLIFPALSNF